MPIDPGNDDVNEPAAVNGGAGPDADADAGPLARPDTAAGLEAQRSNVAELAAKGFSAGAAEPGGGERAFRRARYIAYGYALAVLLGDQWSKAWMVDHLASPAHPIVVIGDGSTPLVDALGARGVTAEEVAAAADRRVLWRLVPASELDLGRPAAELPSQLVATGEAGFPTPRRVQLAPREDGATAATALAAALRVEAADLGTQVTLWQPAGVVSDVAAAPSAGSAVALLERDIEVIPGFMTFVYAENPGAAWSFMRDAPVALRTSFFSVIAILASLGMIWAIWTGWMGSVLGTIALGGVLGGAIGNLIDRNRYTVVVDFVLNYVGEHRWPVWNVADAGISVGVAAIVVEMLLASRRARSAERSSASGERQG